MITLPLRLALFFGALTITQVAFSKEPEEDLSRKLQERIEEFVTESKSTGFSGAVLVTKNGNPIFSRGAGYANKSKKVKNTVDTVFDIGSLTKQFTAAAIMTLVEQDKLSVSDNIGKFF